jgi:hypothetical protein
MRFYRFSSGGSLIVAVAGPAASMAPVVLVVYLTRFGSELLAAKIATVLALIAHAYLSSLHFAGRKYDNVSST